MAYRVGLARYEALRWPRGSPTRSARYETLRWPRDSPTRSARVDGLPGQGRRARVNPGRRGSRLESRQWPDFRAFG